MWTGGLISLSGFLFAAPPTEGIRNPPTDGGGCPPQEVLLAPFKRMGLADSDVKRSALGALGGTKMGAKRVLAVAMGLLVQCCPDWCSLNLLNKRRE